MIRLFWYPSPQTFAGKGAFFFGIPFLQNYRVSPYMTVLFAVIFLSSYLLFRAFSLNLQKREGIWKLHLKR